MIHSCTATWGEPSEIFIQSPATPWFGRGASAERALDLIWEAELPGEKTLPDKWKFAGVLFDDDGSFPRRRGRQCGMLRLITGTDKHGPVSKFVTKPTYLLVDHLQSVGDFGQHKEEGDVSLAVGAAFCLSATALCESLARDLGEPG